MSRCGHAARELDDLQPARHLAERVGAHLAVLGGDDRGQLVLAGVEQLAEREQHLGTPGERRRASPGRPWPRPDRRVDDRRRRRTRPGAATSPVAGSWTSPTRAGSPVHGLPSIQWFKQVGHRASPTVCEGVGQDREPLAGLVLGQGQRRGHAQAVAVEPALADQQAAPRGPPPSRRPPRRRPAPWCRADQLDAEHQPLAAHVADHLAAAAVAFSRPSRSRVPTRSVCCCRSWSSM